MVIASFQTLYSLLTLFAEKEAVWFVGDKHLAKLVAKFIGNKKRYPELDIFTNFEYFFDDNLTMAQTATQVADLFNIHDHTPQAIVLVVGANDLGTISKAQLRARAEDMLTDVAAIWSKAVPTPAIKLSLFVSLLPPQLWYTGYTDQRAGRDARRSVNSHLGKITKILQGVVIPHPELTGQEQWFTDPRSNPWKLSEPAYDLFLQDICRVLAAKLQFSPIEQQREVASKYWYPAPAPTQQTTQIFSTRRRKSARARAKAWRK